VKLRLGDLTFDADARQLLRSGAEIHLSPKAFDLLNETKAVSHFAGGRCGVWKRSFFRSVTGAVPAGTP